MDANTYQSAFKFIGSRITDLSINHTYFNMESSNSESKSFNLNHKVLDIYEKSGILYGTIQLQLKIDIHNKAKDESDPNYQYDLKLCIEGCFSSKGMPQEQFKEMLQINGSAALYSIIRGFVMCTTSQTMLGGQIVLPLLNFTDMPKETESE